MAKVTKEVIRKALKSGDPKFWDALRERAGKIDLSGYDLANAVLADFDLSGLDLSNAELSEADLTGAVLDEAKLDGADLTGATLMDLEVVGGTFVGAAIDNAKVSGSFAQCNFAGSTWENAAVRGAKFIRCDFDGAEIDVAALVRGNRFDRCNFGDRDDLPEELGDTRPEFLQPPVLEGERVTVSRIELQFDSEADLKREVIGTATAGGWEPELVAFLKDDDKLYVGLRDEADVDEIAEWLAFEPRGGKLAAVELSVDPGFETFLEEIVVPLFESAGGDLALTIEQDHEGGSTAVTEVSVTAGVAKPPKQFERKRT